MAATTTPKKTTSSRAKGKQMLEVTNAAGTFEVDVNRFDTDRMCGPDHRDPRLLGDPCQGTHDPAPPGRGSPTGSNAHAYWVACNRCQLRLLYVPSYGAHGLTRAAGPLPSDTAAKVKELGNSAAYSPEMRNKNVGLDAAENSLMKRLEVIRAQKEQHRQGKPETKPKAKATQGYIKEEPPRDPEVMSQTPGRKGRKPEDAAELLEYQNRSEIRYKAEETLDLGAVLSKYDLIPKNVNMDPRTVLLQNDTVLENLAMAMSSDLQQNELVPDYDDIENEVPDYLLVPLRYYEAPGEEQGTDDEHGYGPEKLEDLAPEDQNFIEETLQEKRAACRCFNEFLSQSRVFGALEVKIDREGLKTLTEKELAHLAETALKLHRLCGHPGSHALVRTLAAKGADGKLLAVAEQLKCMECLEGTMKKSSPKVSLEKEQKLWRTLQIDAFVLKKGDAVHHFLLMLDEASGFSVVYEMQYFGEAIGDVERAIGELKKKMLAYLRQDNSAEPRLAAYEMCAAHNRFARVSGFSPIQWAFGRDLSDDPGFATLNAAGDPTSEMNKNLQLRLDAEAQYRKMQARAKISRALNAKPDRSTQYIPGDLVYYRRYKFPKDTIAHRELDLPQGSHFRWFGPARVLACETRVSEDPLLRRPGNVVWIIAQGRLKRAHTSQLRHSSERERLIAEATSAPTLPWTFTALGQTLDRGQYEDLIQDKPPTGQRTRRGRSAVRSRSRGPPVHQPPAQRDPLSEPLIPAARPEIKQTSDDSEEELIPVPEESRPLNQSEMLPEEPETPMDVQRLLHDPTYMPMKRTSTEDLAAKRSEFLRARHRHEMAD
ncbi:unnamed protein product, partial [Durusdinium trenchii]